MAPSAAGHDHSGQGGPRAAPSPRHLRDTAPGQAAGGWYDDDLLYAVVIRRPRVWENAHLTLDFTQHVLDLERTETAEPVAKGVELVLRAARVGAERLEDRAAGRGPSTPLHCLDVAREPQAEAGRWYARHAPADADERLVARGARWEEARWQVLHVIATEPGYVLPGGDKGVSGSGGGN